MIIATLGQTPRRGATHRFACRPATADYLSLTFRPGRWDQPAGDP